MGTRIQAPAMLVWLLCGVVIVVVLDDPYSCLAVIAACAAVASAAPARRPFWALLTIGGIALIVRTALFALSGHGGEHVLFTLPSVRLPGLAGGLVLGGRVTGEVVGASLKEGLDLVAVTALFGAFLSAAGTSQLLRLVPRFLFDAGLVVTVALSFVPQAMRSAREIREAQLSRGLGSGGRGLRNLSVPLIATALEKSIALAESMDSRGYGRTSGNSRVEAKCRTGAVGSGALAAASGLMWAMGYLSGVAGAVCVAAIAALVFCLGRLSKLVARTRFKTHRWTPADHAVAFSAATGALVALAGGGRQAATVWPAPNAGLIAIAAVLAFPWLLDRRRSGQLRGAAT